jgi:hypothetical protein
MSRPSRFLVVVCLVLAPVSTALAQTTTTASTAVRPFEVSDNSFLVEEAYNQEPGIFQNIFGWTRAQGGGWEGSFTQEWPAATMRHQLSYTIPFDGGAGSSAQLGDVLLHYRYQALEDGAGRPAFSPRVSVILPTDRRDNASHRPGMQVNLPFSKQVRDMALHGNAGSTWQRVSSPGVTPGVEPRSVWTSAPLLAGSVIWRATPMFYPMIETTMEFEPSVDADARVTHERVLTISPGFRRGWDVGDAQVVVGAAVPFTRQGGETTRALLTYFSYELPFRRVSAP